MLSTLSQDVQCLVPVTLCLCVCIMDSFLLKTNLFVHFEFLQICFGLGITVKGRIIYLNLLSTMMTPYLF